MPQEAKSKKPKAQKVQGQPRRVPGRKAEIKRKGNKWAYQFKRADYADIEFDTQAEAEAYAKHIKTASIKGAPLRVKIG